MMTYKIIYTQKALADLDAVASYIKLKLCNISASDRIIENFFGEGDSLASFPTLYPLCNDAFLRAWGIRFVPVKNYLLFYVVREDESAVYVIRFLYAKRACKYFARVCQKRRRRIYACFTTHYIQEEQKNMEQNKNSSLGIRKRILRLLNFYSSAAVASCTFSSTPKVFLNHDRCS